MKVTVPVFGFTSALATLSCSLPYVAGLILVVIFRLEIGASSILLIPAIGTKILGEWIFWSQMFPQEMSECTDDWRSSVKSIVFSQPVAVKSLLDMIMDLTVDGFLIYAALKIGVFPAWLFLVIVTCQAVAGLIYGIFVNPFNKKAIRAFSMIITAIITMVALELNGWIAYGSYLQLFGLSHFPNHITMLAVIGAKCLLTGTSVIAKADVAEVIKVESLKLSDS